MSATLKQKAAPPTPDATTRTGPSRRRRRANNKLGKLVAVCAMGAWVAVGLMPVIAALYALYGY